MSSINLVKIRRAVLSVMAKEVAFQPGQEYPSMDVMKLAGSSKSLEVTARAYQALFRSAKLSKVDQIAGASPAGETFGSILAYLEKKPILLIAETGSPPHRRPVGRFRPGDSVLLVDGVYDPDALNNTASAVVAGGGVVKNALALISHSKTKIAQANGIKVHALLSVAEIIRHTRSGKIRKK